MAVIKLTKNDTLFDLNFTVKDSDGAALDLTGYTVTFNLSDKNFKNKISGACTVDDAAAGLCHYEIQAGELNLEPGEYLGELSLTTVGGKVITNPEKAKILIVGECG